MPITYEQVAAAAEDILSRGERVNKERVQAITGGSYSQIQPLLARWREQYTNGPLPELPPEDQAFSPMPADPAQVEAELQDLIGHGAMEDWLEAARQLLGAYRGLMANNALAPRWLLTKGRQAGLEGLESAWSTGPQGPKALADGIAWLEGVLPHIERVYAQVQHALAAEPGAMTEGGTIDGHESRGTPEAR